MQGLFWATAGLSVVTTFVASALIDAANSYAAAPSGSRAEADALDAWVHAEDFLSGLQSFGSLMTFGLLVVLIVWMCKASAAGDVLQPGNRKFGTGWIVGGWFIPFGACVVPKMVMNEIERVAAAERYEGRVVGTWRDHKVTPLGMLWWLAFLTGAVLTRVGAAVSSGADLDLDRLEVGYALVAAGYGALALSAILGALHIRYISRRLSPAALHAA